MAKPPTNLSEIDYQSGLDAAEHLARRLRSRKTQVRSAFFLRASRDAPLPPATELLKNRSHHGLHLKLALFYLWAAGSESPDPKYGDVHTVRGYYDSDVAAFFGFPTTDVNGKRRIANARKRLAGLRPPGQPSLAETPKSGEGEVRLLDIEPRKGRTPVIRLLKEDGSGEKYRSPGAPGSGGKYYSLPVEFWKAGWHLHLSGPAVVALLVLAHQNEIEKAKKPSPNHAELWVNPTLRETRFGFSEDTWYKGANELVHFGLADRITKVIREPFEDESRRIRHTFVFDLENLRVASPPDPALLIHEEKVAEAAEEAY